MLLESLIEDQRVDVPELLREAEERRGSDGVILIARDVCDYALILRCASGSWRYLWVTEDGQVVVIREFSDPGEAFDAFAEQYRLDQGFADDPSASKRPPR